MPKYIKIKKGLDIPIEGNAPEIFIGNIKPVTIKIIPEDFPGLIPKVDVKAGDRVKAGRPVMHDKSNPKLVFVSPVDGIVISVTRGEKRRLLDITIEVDGDVRSETVETNINDSTTNEIKAKLLNAGLWPFIKQRPYDIIADPNSFPRDIFITGFSSAPLAPSYDFIIDREPQAFQLGIDALSKLTEGKTYLSISNYTKSVVLRNAKNAEIIEFEGPHPAGNAGVQINNINPLNKGETIWTITAPDVLLIGRFFQKGYADFTRLIAYTGSEAVKKGYYSVTIGSVLDKLFEANVTRVGKLRYISGNVLTGTQIDIRGPLHFYDSQVTVIPEGDDKHDFIGWASPGLNKKYSAGGTYLSKLISFLKPNRKYRFDARLMGGRRAIIMSNEYDKVFPMDIFPEQLIKATITYNVDKMEQLGIYEVAPEDFALCEFVDTSKLEIQKIMREGLIKLKKEME